MSKKYDPSKAKLGPLAGPNGETYSNWLQKSAESLEIPSDNAIPRFPEPRPGGVDTESAPGPDPDLNVHGAHEHPEPDKKKLLKERLRNARMQMVGKEKDVLKDQVQKQEQEFEENQAQSTAF